MSAFQFTEERGRLFGLAYRLLGSADEAEDAVQDAYLRWDSTEQSTVRNPKAWLAKVITNLCLDRLTTARARRERYVGPWLPEPVLTDDGTLGPLETVEQRDSVSFAMLVLLERLTPAERAVFVLREAFGYRHREVAAIMEISEDHCRQLYRRAGQRIADGRRRFVTDDAARERLAKRFLAAARDGDLAGLERLLADEVTSWADGGGAVGAARRPVSGRNRVARYLIGGFRRVPFEFTFAQINGSSAILAWAGQTLLGVATIDTDGERLHALRIVANPDKLAFVRKQLSRKRDALSHTVR